MGSIRSFYTRILLFLLLSLLATGCGEGIGNVTGTVTYKGKPLPAGTVVFTTKEGAQGFVSDIGNDGTYSVSRIPAGDVTITVKTILHQGIRIGAAGPGGRSGGPPQGAGGPPKEAGKAPQKRLPQKKKPHLHSIRPNEGKDVKKPAKDGGHRKSSLNDILTEGKPPL